MTEPAFNFEPTKRKFETNSGEVIIRNLWDQSPFSNETIKILERLGIGPVQILSDEVRLPQTQRTTLGTFDLGRVLKNLDHLLDQYGAELAAKHCALTGNMPLNDRSEIVARGASFANYLRAHREDLVRILTSYETHEVAHDELDRCIDLFSSLKENERFFTHRINAAASFLPRNQPLYALSCFGLVPSYMAISVDVRPPEAMHFFFKRLEKALNLSEQFPNVKLHMGKRQPFVEHCGRQYRNPKSGRFEPVVDAVIFTGTMENANSLRENLDPRTLLIANGAGHNPVVVGPDADLEKAVHCVARVQLYNQGQDCANPSAILVHASQMKEFLERLRAEVRGIKVGPYSDPEARVGPITEIKDIPRIRKLFMDNKQWLDPSTPGVIHEDTAIVEPTIIVRPLTYGGNFVEQFSPVFFIQQYDSDADLARYFDCDEYRKNAMYVSLFGSSDYVESLLTTTQPDGRPLHDQSTIVRNNDLHAPGIERGTQPYGGYGQGASCYSIMGTVTAKPTLPQRDIYEQIIVPRLRDMKKLNP